MANAEHSQEWHERRLNGIGGSDAPVVVLGECYGRTRRDLWLEKTGRITRPDFATPDMERGRVLEDIAVQEFTKKHGFKARRVNRHLHHAEMPFMVGNIDRQVVGEDAILEVKCPRSAVYRMIKRKGLSEYMLIQGHHYLAVTDKQDVWFWIFCADEWQGELVPVERDEELVQSIIEAEREFWSFVESDTEPPTKTKEIKIPKPPGEIVPMTGEAWRRAVEDWRTANEIKGEAKDLEEAAKARLIELMGEADAAEGAGWRFYNREQKGRESVDKKRLRLEHPELAAEIITRGDPFKRFNGYEVKHD